MECSRFTCTVLTGATGGIGQALAERLLSVTDHLIVSGRHEPTLQTLCDRLDPTRTHAVVGDLDHDHARSALVDRVHSLGGCDLLINNAGVNDFHAFATQADSSVEAVIRSNLLTPMLLTRRLLPCLLQSEQAQVINMGSGLGQVGFPGFAAYCASKFGLRGFTEALHREYAGTGLRVRYFAPRATATSINSPAVMAMNQALRAPLDTTDRVADLFMRFLFNQSAMQQVGDAPDPENLADEVARSGVDAFFAQMLPQIQQHLPA